MSCRFILRLVAVICCSISTVYPYEVGTHSEMSSRALVASVIATDSSVLKELGLNGLQANEKFPDATGRNIDQLFRDGARFEDNFPRPRHHFYDPVNDRPLTVGGTAVGRTSPDWALEDKGQISGMLGIGAQEFSFADARGYLLKALTSATETDRRKNFGLTFQTLGQIIHHIQDMAAPQHGRNDPHLDQLSLLGLNPLFSPSLYEKYTDRDVVRNALPFGGYAPTHSAADRATFNTARNFWHTTEGKGLADFTNRNFVSAGTNFDKPGLFPSPVRDESKKIDMDIQQLCTNANPPCPNPSLTGVITFYGNSVEDRYTRQTVNNPFASSLSIFDADLRKTTGTPLSQPRLFTLNRFNFALAHSFLIPRAVAYSAGLINYFFRGRVHAESQSAGTLLVKNLSTEAMQGDFGLYYDDAQGNRHPVTITACHVGSVDVPVDQGKCKGAALKSVSADANARLAVTFDPQTLPVPPKTPGEYMVVFSGDLGEERADSANGVPGAVIGKLVSNPYNGVLYLAGQDSAGVVRYFKVDRSGISFLQPTELNPLSGVTSVRERSYYFKQAVVTPTPSGALVHKTVGLAFRGQFGDTSLIPNPAAAGALRTVFGIVWSAQSPDPAVGSFEFRLVITDGIGRLARLDYTRRFTNVQGQPAQADGSLQFPELPTNATYTYAGFSTGLLLVSGDGTTIYPRGPTHSRRHGVRIALTAIPTAALFDLPQQSSSSTNKPGFLTVTQVGECVVNYLANDFSGRPSFPATVTAPLRREDHLVGESESTSSSTQIEDFMLGELLSYEIRTEGRGLNHTITESCVAAATDWSGPGSQVKVNIKYSRQSERIGRSVVSYLLPNGALQYVSDTSGTPQATAVNFSCGLQAGTFGPVPNVNSSLLIGDGGDFFEVNYSYEGFGPCPSQPATIRVPGDSGTPKHRLYRALTDRSMDAVYTEEANNVAVLKFRTERLPSGFFLADASPIGEVFIATPDLSLLVHEPGTGNMPVLTRELIPSGIVRLLAAVWM